MLSAAIPNPVDYATLSHCWGSLEILKLEKDNLCALQESIPWHSLCETFRDAYKVSGELGLKYLWIDSLYIIQDDPDDWDREAFLMSEVYGGSSLNIAASMASMVQRDCGQDETPHPPNLFKSALRTTT